MFVCVYFLYDVIPANVTHWAFNCKTIKVLFLLRPCGGGRRRRRHDARRVIQNRERFSALAEPSRRLRCGTSVCVSLEVLVEPSWIKLLSVNSLTKMKMFENETFAKYSASPTSFTLAPGGEVGGSAAVLHHFTLRWCCSLVGNRHRCVDDWRHPGDCAGEMILKRPSSPLLLTVTCMCFSGGLAWSYQREADSNGYSDTFKVAWGLLVESARMFGSPWLQFNFFSTAKSVLKITFPRQSTPASSRLEKWRRVTGTVEFLVLWCLNSDGGWRTEGTLSHFRGA